MPMTKVVADITMSLDGFVTGPDPDLEHGLGRGGEPLHPGGKRPRGRHKDVMVMGGGDVIRQCVDTGLADELIIHLAPIVLGWVKTVTGSFSAGILLVAVLVFAGGIAVLFGVPRQQQAPKSGV